MSAFKELYNYMSVEQYSAANLMKMFRLSIWVLRISVGGNEYLDLITGKLLTHESVANPLKKLT